MDLLKKYGIKEVADVVFYHLNPNGEPDKPVLYLDSLKVSTIEQTAENVSARGGKGNAELISWDYNKEINLTLEDALYSMKSLGVMFGDDNTSNNTKQLYKTIVVNLPAGTTISDTELSGYFKDAVKVNDLTFSGIEVYDDQGSKIDTSTTPSITKAGDYFLSAKISGGEVRGVVEISANTFPGQYMIQGDTYGRRETDGEDELFIFIINKAKVLSEVTITLEAEGDPSTFNMPIKVLKPSNGKPMMELIQYGTTAAKNQ